MCRLALLAATLLVAACESPTRPVPQLPTPASPIPAPPAPAAPAPAGLVDLRGEYTLTFEVGSGCAEVPKELRTRTYEASIRYHQSFGSSDLFHAYLSGAKFHEDQLPVWIEVAGNSVGMDLSDNAILEQPSPGAYLATAGYGLAPVQSSEQLTITGSFSGYFKYCAATCAVQTMTRDMCSSPDSRWTLTRR